MSEGTVSITDSHFSDDEMRASAAEAAAELGELVADRGLEHLFDEPTPGREQSGDEFTRLANEYNYVAASAPEAAFAHTHFGKLFIICEMYEQAAVALERAVTLRPDSADARCLYGRALAALNRLDEARQEYVEACQLDPRLFESQFELEVLNFRIEAREGAAGGASRN
jgi:tetratricopeptide (TPR) repeat protein